MISGSLVREARKRAGLTQTELAERLGKSQSEIGRWERGEVRPSLETLREIVGACDLELTIGVAEADDSYARHLRRTRVMTPAERVRHAMGRARAARRIRARAAAARG